MKCIVNDCGNVWLRNPEANHSADAVVFPAYTEKITCWGTLLSFMFSVPVLYYVFCSLGYSYREHWCSLLTFCSFPCSLWLFSISCFLLYYVFCSLSRVLFSITCFVLDYVFCSLLRVLFSITCFVLYYVLFSITYFVLYYVFCSFRCSQCQFSIKCFVLLYVLSDCCLFRVLFVSIFSVPVLYCVFCFL